MQAQTNTNSGFEYQRPAASPYLDTPRAAAFLQMTPRNLQMLRASGTGPKFVKLGRKVAYRIETLRAWVEAREFGSTAEAKRALA